MPLSTSQLAALIPAEVAQRTAEATLTFSDGSAVRFTYYSGKLQQQTQEKVEADKALLLRIATDEDAAIDWLADYISRYIASWEVEHDPHPDGSSGGTVPLDRASVAAYIRDLNRLAPPGGGVELVGMFIFRMWDDFTQGKLSGTPPRTRSTATASPTAATTSLTPTATASRKSSTASTSRAGQASGRGSSRRTRSGGSRTAPPVRQMSATSRSGAGTTAQVS